MIILYIYSACWHIKSMFYERKHCPSSSEGQNRIPEAPSSFSPSCDGPPWLESTTSRCSRKPPSCPLSSVHHGSKAIVVHERWTESTKIFFTKINSVSWKSWSFCKKDPVFIPTKQESSIFHNHPRHFPEITNRSLKLLLTISFQSQQWFRRFLCQNPQNHFLFHFMHS
jgi:hypothetical protein